MSTGKGRAGDFRCLLGGGDGHRDRCHLYIHRLRARVHTRERLCEASRRRYTRTPLTCIKTKTKY